MDWVFLFPYRITFSRFQKSDVLYPPAQDVRQTLGKGMSMRLDATVTANPPEAADEAIAHCESISVRESICWVDVKNRHFPKPLKVGYRMSARPVDEICALIPQPNTRND